MEPRGAKIEVGEPKNGDRVAIGRPLSYNWGQRVIFEEYGVTEGGSKRPKSGNRMPKGSKGCPKGTILEVFLVSVADPV